MTMETFNFPYHGSPKETYPNSSQVVQFGKGYRFASKPKGPDQIVFTLPFNMMQFFENVSIDPGPPIVVTRTVNRTKMPLYNMQLLIDFYERHRLYKKFIYPHPRRGNVVVRFNKPLEVPATLQDGLGVTEPFTVELILEP